MACPITVAKFVGTISLGLLTGVSYSVSAVTIPALQHLPTATSAAQCFEDIQNRTRKSVLTLSNLTALSLLTAFTLASPRRKHPYLVWTSIIALIGGTGIECWINRKTMSWRSAMCSSSPCSLGLGSWTSTHLGYGRNAGAPQQQSRRREEEESNSASSEILIVDESDAIPTPTTRDHSASRSEQSDVNGETVKEGMERERKLQKIRTWILAVAFSMGVVGIWGEGA